MKLYHYVGPEHIRLASRELAGGTHIRTKNDLLAWRKSHRTESSFPFVICEKYELLLAPQHTEHVVCVSGRPALSGGQLSFDSQRVIDVSNLATGYCPEPESWDVVAKVLDEAGIDHPGGFTVEIIFRRCESCGESNLVKDGWFFCSVCDHALPVDWNYDRVARAAAN